MDCSVNSFVTPDVNNSFVQELNARRNIKPVADSILLINTFFFFMLSDFATQKYFDNSCLKRQADVKYGQSFMLTK